jgi:hypothetical protein
VELADRSGKPLLAAHRLTPLPFPVTSATWRRHFADHFQDNSKILSAVDLAHYCTIRFSSDDVGFVTVLAEREFTPLRWIVSRASNSVRLTLVDDTGSIQGTTVSRYDLSTPTIKQTLQSQECERLSQAEIQPGLYVAEAGSCSSAIMISPKITTFSDLQLPTHVTSCRRTPEDIGKLVIALEKWSIARVSKDLLSTAMKRKVTISILHEILRVIAGDRWWSFERALIKQSGTTLQQAAQTHLKRADEIALGTDFSGIAAGLADLVSQQRILPFVELAGRRIATTAPKKTTLDDRIRDFPWNCEFALRLASGSSSIRTWSADCFHAGIAYLIQYPALARAARFLVIAIDEAHEPLPLGSQMYERWEWE